MLENIMLDVEINFIVQNYNKLTNEEIENHLGITHGELKYIATKFELKKNFRWSEEEIDFLKNNYPECGTKRSAIILGRNHHTVRRKLQELGLKK
jgi:hypothetical protein